MAKLGYLFINSGKWKDTQIISKDWIEKASKSSIDANSVWEYGYQWWIKNYLINAKEYISFSARGWGGQVIIIFPENDIIIVLTGGNYTTYEPVEEILQNYILSSVFKENN